MEVGQEKINIILRAEKFPWMIIMMIMIILIVIDIIMMITGGNE
jgi:hypothetical protein